MSSVVAIAYKIAFYMTKSTFWFVEFSFFVSYQWVKNVNAIASPSTCKMSSPHQCWACTLLFKSNGIFFLRWQNMVFIFKVQTWHFVCGIRRSFAFTMENILSVWYTATPGWTSKCGKVWKTRCQNAATRANIWRCFLVSWDDKYLWVMVSNNRHELYFYSKLLCFSSIWFFFWPNTVSKYQRWTNSYLIPSNA